MIEIVPAELREAMARLSVQLQIRERGIRKHALEAQKVGCPAALAHLQEIQREIEVLKGFTDRAVEEAERAVRDYDDRPEKPHLRLVRG